MQSPRPRRPLWFDHRTLWRWHFYAGLVCIPFVLLLATTGSIYLFRPQVEAMLDAPYADFGSLGPGGSPAAIARAAVAAVPGSTLKAYQLPASPRSAVQVLVSQGDREVRVYVRPDTLTPIKVVNEDDRFFRVIFRLHGELLAGDAGSRLVELAACWAIVMLLTGLCLWWPRGTLGLAGVAWPRMGGGGRQALRDLHAVTGFWISLLALFLLLTGLPWAKSWGGYLKSVRHLAGATQPIDWTTGRADELARRRAFDQGARAALAAAGDHAPAHHMEDMAGMDMPDAAPAMAQEDFASLDRLAAPVARLRLPEPVLIAPPSRPGGHWTARSDSTNRPQRVTLTLDEATGGVLAESGFSDQHWIDKAVAVGVAAHEGQLFGPANQALGVITTLGLVTISISGGLMWWRRRPSVALGAPPVVPGRGVGPAGTVAMLLLFAYLPLLGASAILVFVVELLVLRRIPAAARWLGLTAGADDRTDPRGMARPREADGAGRLRPIGANVDHQG